MKIFPPGQLCLNLEKLHAALVDQGVEAPFRENIVINIIIKIIIIITIVIVIIITI